MDSFLLLVLDIPFLVNKNQLATVRTGFLFEAFRPSITVYSLCVNPYVTTSRSLFLLFFYLILIQASAAFVTVWATGEDIKIWFFSFFLSSYCRFLLVHHVWSFVPEKPVNCFNDLWKIISHVKGSEDQCLTLSASPRSQPFLCKRSKSQHFPQKDRSIKNEPVSTIYRRSI